MPQATTRPSKASPPTPDDPTAARRSIPRVLIRLELFRGRLNDMTPLAVGWCNR